MKKNGHDEHIVYVEGRDVVFGSLPLWHVASLRHAIRHGHNQRRSSHGERFTLASRHFLPKSSNVYFFDSYGIIRLVPEIAAFIRLNCTVWDYNRTQLQGLTSNICGKYYCLFALYMDRMFNAKQFVGRFDGASSGDQQIVRAFASEFGSPWLGSGRQCSSRIL